MASGLSPQVLGLRVRPDAGKPDTDAIERLHEAVESRDLDLIRHLVENGVSADHVSPVTGLTSLQQAVISNDVDVAQILVSLGAQTSLSNAGGRRKGITVHASYPPLVLAAERGHFQIVRLLLDTGQCDVNVETRRPHTALIAASERGFTGIALMLIDAGADVNKVDQRFRSALYFSVYQQQHTLTARLIQAGAHLNAADSKGDTVCHLAARKGHGDLLRLLADAGADMNAENVLRDNQTPLYDAIVSAFPHITRTLLEQGADPNTGLLGVFMSNHCDFTILRLLMEFGADVNSHHNNSRYPLLCLAINKEWYDAARFLILADYELDREVTLESIIDLDLLNTNNDLVSAFVQWVDDFTKGRVALKRLVRTFIRLQLQGSADSSLKLREKVCKLPLPMALKGYLCYMDI